MPVLVVSFSRPKFVFESTVYPKTKTYQSSSNSEFRLTQKAKQSHHSISLKSIIDPSSSTRAIPVAIVSDTLQRKEIMRTTGTGWLNRCGHEKLVADRLVLILVFMAKKYIFKDLNMTNTKPQYSKISFNLVWTILTNSH